MIRVAIYCDRFTFDIRGNTPNIFFNFILVFAKDERLSVFDGKYHLHIQLRESVSHNVVISLFIKVWLGRANIHYKMSFVKRKEKIIAPQKKLNHLIKIMVQIIKINIFAAIYFFVCNKLSSLFFTLIL